MCDGMGHEEHKDPAAQSTLAHSTTSAVDLSDRDNKETPVVKEDETYDADAFEKVEAGWCSYFRNSNH